MGTDFAGGTASAQSVPWPTTLGGVTVQVTDSAPMPVTRFAGLPFVSASHINSGPELHSLGFTNVHEVSFGGKSSGPNYANMRAFMWARELKDWLGKGAIDPEDKKLAADLAAPGFHHRIGGDGALVVESKDDMRERGFQARMTETHWP